jgi:lysophospholipase L1-like esterase
LALADVNAAFTALVTAKAGVYNGVTITPNFTPPTGAFSEDGVHPNSRGYAFMANIFIRAINAKFTATVPEASIAEYKGVGLPVNAQ